MRSWLALPVAAIVVGSACSHPSVTVSPSGLSVNAGDPATTFIAAVPSPGDTVSWSISPEVGSLSSTSRKLPNFVQPTVEYIPPSSVPNPTVVTLTATVGHSGLSGSATITINPRGQLEVSVIAPGGGIPLVGVTGPFGFSATLQTTTLLEDLGPGTYDITASPIATADPMVSLEYVPSVTGSPAVVSLSQTADSGVIYSLQSGSGHLWLPWARTGGRSILAAFSATQLRDAGAQPQPDLSLPVEGGAGIAFDRSGNLWVSDSFHGQLIAYSASQLTSGAAATPLTTVTDQVFDAGPEDAGIRFLNGVAGIAFDRNGDLWVANCRGSDREIGHYTASQLSSGGPQLPKSALFSWVFPADQDAGTESLPCPRDLAFDADGTLWVANSIEGDGNLVAFTVPGKYRGFTNPIPDSVILSRPDPVGGPASVRLSPSSLAFDPDGGLWAANRALNTVTKLNVHGLAGVTRPIPEVILYSSGDAGISAPGSVLFDNTGSLWVVSDGNGVLVQFSNPESWQGFVSPAGTATTIGVPGQTMSGRAAFDPASPALPLFH